MTPSILEKQKLQEVKRLLQILEILCHKINFIALTLDSKFFQLYTISILHSLRHPLISDWFELCGQTLIQGIQSRD